MKDESVDLGIWDKLTRVVLLLILVATTIGSGYLCAPLMQQNARMRQRNLELDAQVQREEDTARQLKASLDALRSDPKASLCLQRTAGPDAQTWRRLRAG